MKTEFLDKRLERLEQLNLLRDLDFEEGRELAEIKRIKQLILSGVSNSVKIAMLKQLEELSDHIPAEIYTRKVIEIQKQFL